MDVLHERVAGLDVHKKVVVACVRRPAPGGQRQMVVVVDQFEELFTACADDQVARRFVEALTAGAADPSSPLVVALVIRGDCYDACAEYPGTGTTARKSQVLVAAMSNRELREAVQEPARRAGLTVADGLADAVCADAAGQPGALPLIWTALLETWVRRSGDTLTLAGYIEAGGVRGAVARLAEGVYDRLDQEGKQSARHIFLRLTDPQGATTDVRRRAARVASRFGSQQLNAHRLSWRPAAHASALTVAMLSSYG